MRYISYEIKYTEKAKERCEIMSRANWKNLNTLLISIILLIKIPTKSALRGASISQRVLFGTI